MQVVNYAYYRLSSNPTKKRGAYTRPFQHTRFEGLELCFEGYAVVTVCITRNLITEVIAAVGCCIAFIK